MTWDELFEQEAQKRRKEVEAWESGGGAERNAAKAEAARQSRIRRGEEDDEGNSLMYPDDEAEGGA